MNDKDEARPLPQGYDRQAEVDRARDATLREGNPPRTTTGKMTAPKFGSAGSGGAELEPGPERD
ncbi:MAG: hypothetical protein JWN53_2258 [Gemmatimonadetes bacterium]|nr:hypothetical protein [Gemmatimonadota bacterium]